MFHRLPMLLIITVLAAVIGTALAQTGSGKSRMFGKGHPFTVDDLPPGRMRAKIEGLPETARNRAMDWLHRFEFPENDVASIVIDNEGAALYVDSAALEPGNDTDQGAEAAVAAPEPAASATEDAFQLHSRPDTSNMLYLDFDGHSFSGTAWSSDTINATPFDLDGSPTSFSEAERRTIAEIWHRVAEDFAAFDIDVTTEEPASFGPYTSRVLITSKTQTDGTAMPYNTGGGVAYIGVWGRSDYASYYSPALVYYDRLANDTTYIAEASSHEFGHSLGLSHDGTSSLTYYAGHGSGNTSWAPIMGSSYYKNVTQWSKGEYPGANNTQDDLAVIASHLSLIEDDHGDTHATATPLAVEVDGQIRVTNPEFDPHNMDPDNKGAIETIADQDVFSFTVAAGQVDLSVIPAWDAFTRTSNRGANLDIQASLQDASGATLVSSELSTETHAGVTATVAAGTYYLVVSGVGNGNYSDYASAGQYFISGKLPTGPVPNLLPTAAFDYYCTNLGCNFTDASSDSDGTVSAWTWNFGDGEGSSKSSPSHTYATAGSYTVTLTVTDDNRATATANHLVTVTAEMPKSPPTAAFSFSCTDLNCGFTDQSGDDDGSVTGWTGDFGDGMRSTVQNPSHSYVAGNLSTALVTVNATGGAANGGGGNGIAMAEATRPPSAASLRAVGLESVLAYGADNSGRTDSTVAIQAAINAAYRENRVVYFPAGSYQVSDTLKLYQPASSNFTRKGHYLLGPASGAPAIIRLKDRAPGFGSCAGYPHDMRGCQPATVKAPAARGVRVSCEVRKRSTLKPIVMIWREENRCKAPGRQDPQISRGGLDYNNVVKNLTIVTGDNPGAVGIRHVGAEGSTNENVTIDARGGFAGFYSINSSGGGSRNIEVIGGQHAIYAPIARGGTAHLVGLRVSGQRQQPLYFTPRYPITIVGFAIAAHRGPVITLHGNGRQGSQLALIDGTIRLERDNEPAIANNKQSVYLKNVHVKGAKTVLANSKDLGTSVGVADPSRWSRIGELAYMGDFSDVYRQQQKIVNGRPTSGSYLNGEIVDLGRRILPTAGGSPPRDLIARHIIAPGLCHPLDPTLENVKLHGARGDGKTDDTAAIIAAINRARARQTNGVLLPVGRYRVSRSIDLGGNLRLCGVARDKTILLPTRWLLAKPTPVIETANSRRGHSVLSELKIELFENPAYAIRWRNGRRSVVNSVWVHTHWGSDHDVPRKRIQIVGHGGGRWYHHHIEVGSNHPTHRDGRQVLIEGTREPLTFYGYHCQFLKAEASPMTEIRDAANVTLIGGKSEWSSNERTWRDFPLGSMSIVLGVYRSSAIRLYGMEGLAHTDVGRGVIEVHDSHDVSMVNISRREAPSIHAPARWYLLKEGSGAGAVGVTGTGIVGFYRRD